MLMANYAAVGSVPYADLGSREQSGSADAHQCRACSVSHGSSASICEATAVWQGKLVSLFGHDV